MRAARAARACCWPCPARRVLARSRPAQAAGSASGRRSQPATIPMPRDRDHRRCRWTRSAATSAVYNAVKQAYVDPVDDKKLMQSAIRGLLLDLDPHSTYFDKDDAEAFDEQATRRLRRHRRGTAAAAGRHAAR